MSWNYRVMRRGGGLVGIHEVYYDEHGKVTSWTQNATCVEGESERDLREQLEMIASALRQPTLDYYDETSAVYE